MNNILIICIAIPLLIIFFGAVRTLIKHIELQKYFNINREVKELKETTLETREIQDNPPQEADSRGTKKQGSTYLGESDNKEPKYMPNNAKHVFVCGTTGSGKTVALSNFIDN